MTSSLREKILANPWEEALYCSRKPCDYSILKSMLRKSINNIEYRAVLEFLKVFRSKAKYDNLIEMMNNVFTDKELLNKLICDTTSQNILKYYENDKAVANGLLTLLEYLAMAGLREHVYKTVYKMFSSLYTKDIDYIKYGDLIRGIIFGPLLALPIENICEVANIVTDKPASIGQTLIELDLLNMIIEFIPAKIYFGNECMSSTILKLIFNITEYSVNSSIDLYELENIARGTSVLVEKLSFRCHEIGSTQSCRKLIEEIRKTISPLYSKYWDVVLSNRVSL